MASDYKTGTVSIVNGSPTLTSVGATWALADLREGDTLFLKGFAIPIESVDSDTQITLTEDWPGTDVAGGAYRLRYQSDVSRMAAKVQTLIDGLANNKGDKGDPGANFDADATGNFTDRDGYDAEAEFFSFLSLDGDAGATTTEPSYFVRKGVAGNWLGPIKMRGDKGDPGDQGDAGDNATLEVASDGASVVGATTTAIDFAALFDVQQAGGDATRALIDIDPAAFVSMLDGHFGSTDWRTGGGVPAAAVTHGGEAITNGGEVVTHTI